VIDRPAPATLDRSARPLANRPPRRLGPLPLTPINVVVGLTMIGSILFIAYVVIAVEDNQIPLLASGFAVLGASFTAVAIGSLVEVWRAASRAATARAVGLAFLGGVAGLAAIGCFTATALAALVWNS
jgi:hypothetical protein